MRSAGKSAVAIGAGPFLAGRPHAALAVLAAPLMSAGCMTPHAPAPVQAPPLLNTEWVLIEFQSSKDAIGIIRPNEGEVYTVMLNPDGSAAMGLFCNRGFGSWTSPDARTETGSLTIHLVGSSMAACPPAAITRLPADFEQVRTFVIRGGRLHLNLAMDGGDYVWEAKR